MTAATTNVSELTRTGMGYSAASEKTGIRVRDDAPVTGYVILGDGMRVSMAEYLSDPRAYCCND